MKRCALVLFVIATSALAQSVPMTPLRIAVIHKATAPSPTTCVAGVSPDVITDDNATLYTCIGTDYAAVATGAWMDTRLGVAGLSNADDPILSYQGSVEDSAATGWRVWAPDSTVNDPFFDCTMNAVTKLVTCNAHEDSGTLAAWKFTGDATSAATTLEVSGNVKASRYNNLTVTDNGNATTTLNIAAGKTLTVSDNGSVTGTNTGDQLEFKTIDAPSGTDPVADTTTDTLTLTASGSLTITGDSATDTLAFAVTETDSAHDTCGEISGCVVGAITAAGVPAAETDSAHDTAIEVGAIPAAGYIVVANTKGVIEYYGGDETTAPWTANIFQHDWGTIAESKYGLYVVAQAAHSTDASAYDSTGIMSLSKFIPQANGKKLGGLYGGQFVADDANAFTTGTLSRLVGGQFTIRTEGAKTGEVITEAQAGNFDAQLGATNTAFTNLYGLKVGVGVAPGAGSTVTNQYGLYIDEVTAGGTIKDGIFLANATSGYHALTIRDQNVWIGSNAAGQLDLTGTTVKVNGNALSGANTGDQTCATTSGCVVSAITAAGVPAAETDAAHDTCAEISGCVVGATTNTGTVTSVATTAPITGGTFTTSGTIACATCTTNAAALTANAIVIGGGSQATSALGSLGTTTTLLHGNAAGAPTFGAVVSGDITDGTVALADMANLAQDLFIGRVTASTGVPETATITAAARTVLDDTTVGAMVDTIGGATASGTGGLVRRDSPTFTTTATGVTEAFADADTSLATTGFVAAAGPTYARVSGSDSTVSGALAAVTGLTVALTTGRTYEFEAFLSATSSEATNGNIYAVQYSSTASLIEALATGTLAATSTQTVRVSALHTATAKFLTVNGSGGVFIKGIITTTGSGNLTIEHGHLTSGTTTTRIGSFLKVTRIA